jgi:hypothetical protein
MILRMPLLWMVTIPLMTTRAFHLIAKIIIAFLTYRVQALLIMIKKWLECLKKKDILALKTSRQLMII